MCLHIFYAERINAFPTESERINAFPTESERINAFPTESERINAFPTKSIKTKGEKMKKTIIALTLIIIAIKIHGYSIYNLNLGTRISNHDARSSALGETGSAAGFNLFDANVNPSNLYYLDDVSHFQLNYSLIKNSESRAIPMWNFFDSYIAQSTYARNENFFNELSFGIQTLNLKFNDVKLKFAFTYQPVINFSANYREEVRNNEDSNNDNYPPIIAMNYLEASGMLNSGNLIFNVGMPVKSFDVSLAAELTYYRGSYDYEKRIIWSDTARERTTVVLEDYDPGKTEHEMDGFGVKFGLGSQVTERIRLGLSYSPKVKLDASYKESGWQKEDYDYILPSSTRFGMLYMPRNPFRTNFHADFEMLNYEDIDSSFENGYAFYVGMEHYVGRAIPFRMGFSHKTAAQDRGIGLPTVSIGTGFGIMKNLNLDLSAEFGRREYVELDLFPDGFYNVPELWNRYEPADRGWDNPDKVTESFFKMFVSVVYKL